jgi:hypothetical protein
MPLWLQHLLVLLIVAASLAFVARQMVRTFRFKKSKLGACCAKGCDAAEPAKQQVAERIVFMPVEMLTASKRAGPRGGGGGVGGGRA